MGHADVTGSLGLIFLIAGLTLISYRINLI